MTETTEPTRNDIPEEKKDEPVMPAETQEETELTPEQERQAQTEVLSKCVEWMRVNPKYTMTELAKKKAEFLEEARKAAQNDR